MEFEDLLERLKRDYPALRFRAGKKFMYRAPRLVVYKLPEQMREPTRENVRETACGAEQNCDCLQLLHEVGHAVLGHADYRTDVERVKIERAAWDKAAELAERYGVRYDEDFVEEELDTYRDWLHQKSKCPKCQTVRYQNQNGEYHCPFCENYI